MELETCTVSDLQVGDIIVHPKGLRKGHFQIKKIIYTRDKPNALQVGLEDLYKGGHLLHTFLDMGEKVQRGKVMNSTPGVTHTFSHVDNITMRDMYKQREEVNRRSLQDEIDFFSAVARYNNLLERERRIDDDDDNSSTASMISKRSLDLSDLSDLEFEPPSVNEEQVARKKGEATKTKLESGRFSANQRSKIVDSLDDYEEYNYDDYNYDEATKQKVSKRKQEYKSN